MTTFEYKVVPAPTHGTRARGTSGPEARFALSLERLMNEMAGDGWEYQRAEMLPSTDKTGLMQSQTSYRHVLIFRRANRADLSAFDPRAVTQEAAPLLPPPPRDGVGEAVGDGIGEAGTAQDDHGLRGLLRRRAGRQGAAGDGDDGVSNAPLDDLAARFAVEDTSDGDLSAEASDVPIEVTSPARLDQGRTAAE